MKLNVKVVAWSLLLVGGCSHKTNQSRNQPLAPPVIDTLPAKPDNAPINLPPPVVTVPKTSTPTVSKDETAPPKPPPRHKKPKSTPAAAPQPPQEASNGGAPEVSAVGQLSSGDPADLKKQTTDTITDTDHGLKELHRKFNEQEQKTVTQIREFLKQARAALASGDVDGAHTLALKAKVLLSELNQ